MLQTLYKRAEHWTHVRPLRFAFVGSEQDLSWFGISTSWTHPGRKASHSHLPLQNTSSLRRKRLWPNACHLSPRPQSFRAIVLFWCQTDRTPHRPAFPSATQWTRFHECAKDFDKHPNTKKYMKIYFWNEMWSAPQWLKQPKHQLVMQFHFPCRHVHTSFNPGMRRYQMYPRTCMHLNRFVEDFRTEIGLWCLNKL